MSSVTASAASSTLRSERGLRLKDVAETAGISVPYLSDLERGRTNPSLETLQTLAGAYTITVHDLLEGVELMPQTMVNVRLPEGSDWTRNPRLAGARALVERELGSSGRVLIRASGTEPVLRVMVEARDAGVGRACAEKMAAAAAVA